MEKKITKEELKSKFFHYARENWSTMAWDTIGPYLDDSKFISKDEQEFKEWLNKSYPPLGCATYHFSIEHLKQAWMASRHK